MFADSSNFDFNSTAANEFSARATGGVRFVTGIDDTGVPDAGVALAADGTAWGTISARAAKENLVDVDPVEILEKLAALNIQQWNYRFHDASVKQIGPMAEDFKAAFGLNGPYTGTITTQEIDGVALAAIQGLNRKLEERDAVIAQLQAEVAEIRTVLAERSQ